MTSKTKLLAAMLSLALFATTGISFAQTAGSASNGSVPTKAATTKTSKKRVSKKASGKHGRKSAKTAPAAVPAASAPQK